VTKEWLSNPKYYERIPLPQLCVLLNEAADPEIGMYGFGIFKFTGAFLGTVGSVQVHYSNTTVQ
jgi:hypothetical protein